MTLSPSSTKDMTDSKGRLLVKLPEIKFYLHKVKLEPEVRALYDEVSNYLKNIVAGFMKAGTAGSQYSHVRTPNSLFLPLPSLVTDHTRVCSRLLAPTASACMRPKSLPAKLHRGVRRPRHRLARHIC